MALSFFPSSVIFEVELKEKKSNLLKIQEKKHGVDKAEGLAIRDDKLIIAYDSPDNDRKIEEHQVKLDLISLERNIKGK